MKAILVIDMPKECNDCPLLNYEYGCVRIGPVGSYYGERNPECPLRPLPRKLTEADISWGEQRGYRGGWNNCLAEITGETE